MLLTSEFRSGSDRSKMRLATSVSRLATSRGDGGSGNILGSYEPVQYCDRQLRSYSYIASAPPPVLAELLAEPTDPDGWDVFMWWREVLSA